AAARALADDPQPDEAMINPLFAAMGSNRALTEAAARALGHYKSNPEVVGRLIDFVQRHPPSEAARVAVVRALARMPDKRAAEFLVTTLSNADESAGVRDAAADALIELSGAPENGTDVAQWQRWWSQNGPKSDEAFRADVL